MLKMIEGEMGRITLNRLQGRQLSEENNNSAGTMINNK